MWVLGIKSRSSAKTARAQLIFEPSLQLQAQLLRVLATLPKDPSSVPSTHIRKLTTTCNTSSRGSETQYIYMA